MPRVHHVKKARKAVKHAGIEPGDSYYWWKFRKGGKRYSKTLPRGSDLTQSDKISRARVCAENLEDLRTENYDDIDDIKAELSNIADEIREVAQEYRDAKENMPESLQDSPTAELCENNADELESWADDVENCLDSIDADDEDGEGEHWKDEAQSAIDEQAGSCPL